MATSGTLRQAAVHVAPSPRARVLGRRARQILLLDSLFEQFLRERRYLKNVSPRTCEWDARAWKTFLKAQPAGLASTHITSPLVLQKR